MNLNGIEALLKELESVLGKSDNAKRLLHIFENSYLKSQNLADATRYLVNELFGQYGIVILDANDKKLKEKLIPIIKEDVVNQSLHLIISERTKELSKELKSQAFVRNINFFQISEGKITSNHLSL